MSDKYLIGVVTTSLLMLLTHAVHANGLDEMADLPGKLLSPKIDIRREAAGQIRDARDGVAKGLVKNLKELSLDRDNTYGSSLHLTTVATARWRIVEAIPLLAQIVNLQLDPSTFPVGARYTVGAFYPAADALATIGGREVVEAIWDRLEAPADEDVVRTCTWVLAEVLGADLALAAVDLRQADDAADVAEANFHQVRSLLEGLEEKKAILLAPEG